MGAVANISNYRDQIGSVEGLGFDPDQYILIYNESGAAINNGDVFFLSFIPTTTAGKWPTVGVPAASAVRRQVVVVNNWPLKKGSIANADWGYVQLSGYCAKVFMTASIANKVFLQGANGTSVAVSDGAAMTEDSFAITITTDAVAAAGYTDCWLLGRESFIG